MDDRSSSSDVRLVASFTMTPLYVYDLGHAARSAWHALQTYALGSGECWPSVPNLAARAGVSEATIHRGLRKLEEAGAVDIVRRLSPFGASRSNLYVLRMEPPAAAGKKTRPGVSRDRGEGVNRDTGRVSTVTPEVDTGEGERTMSEDIVRASSEERSALWEALAVVVGWRPEAGDRPAAKRFGQAQRHLVAVSATADEVKRRAANYRRLFGGVQLTPEALTKHWSALAEEPSERDARAILEAASHGR